MSNIEVYDAPHEGKDYILQVRIKNGPLLRAIRMRGYSTLAAFAQACGCNYTAIAPLLALKRAPINKNGQWSKIALKMACVLRLPPDSLFPEQHLTEVLKRNSGEVEVSKEEVAALIAPEAALTPEQEMIRNEMQRAITHALTKLSPREERALRLRFGLDGGGERTLEEVGQLLGRADGRDDVVMCRGRAQQIIAKALRRMKLFSRAKLLRPYLNDEGWVRDDDPFAPRPPPRVTHMGPVQDLPPEPDEVEEEARSAKGETHLPKREKVPEGWLHFGWHHCEDGGTGHAVGKLYADNKKVTLRCLRCKHTRENADNQPMIFDSPEQENEKASI